MLCHFEYDQPLFVLQVFPQPLRSGFFFLPSPLTVAVEITSNSRSAASHPRNLITASAALSGVLAHGNMRREKPTLAA